MVQNSTEQTYWAAIVLIVVIFLFDNLGKEVSKVLHDLKTLAAHQLKITALIGYFFLFYNYFIFLFHRIFFPLPVSPLILPYSHQSHLVLFNNYTALPV